MQRSEIQGRRSRYGSYGYPLLYEADYVACTALSMRQIVAPCTLRAATKRTKARDRHSDSPCPSGLCRQCRREQEGVRQFVACTGEPEWFRL